MRHLPAFVLVLLTACAQPPETDPVFAESAVGTSSAEDLARWNEAASWGDHAAAGYVTNAALATTPAGTITEAQIDGWNTAQGWGDHGAAGYLVVESDPAFGASVAASLTPTLLDAWNAAAEWGDHELGGYLKAESDPAYVASVAAGITAADVTSWRATAAFGDHRASGYLKTESDPAYAASTAAGITAADVTSWRATAAFGDHRAGGYLTRSPTLAPEVVAVWNGTALEGGSIVDGSNGVVIGTSAAGGSLDVLSVAFDAAVVDVDSPGYVGGYSLTEGGQSFTATKTGRLEFVELRCRSPLAAASPARLRIYAGEGYGGALLAVNTVTLQPGGSLFYQRLPVEALPALVAGSKYSFRVDVASAPQSWLGASGVNSYAGGRGYPSFDDLTFRTWVGSPAPTAVSTLTVKEGVVNLAGVLHLEPRAQPTTARAGDLYFSNVTNTLHLFNGTSWTEL